ncbi:50S ribosomal protein L10 [Candidatus Peregrinibacteria bacterium]|nr:MAG: 50S ribosomal protein L10 [Candidatus Peregrinibacteria bacterium]
MPVSRQQKEESLAQLIEAMKSARAIYFAKNLGMGVRDSQDLRRKLRDSGNSFRMAKKTLIKKAIQEVFSLEISDEALEGAVGVAFSEMDEVSAVKTIADVAKKTKKIELTGAIFEGSVIGKEDTIRISKTPSREELLAQLLGSFMAPLSGFVGVGNQLISGFVRVVDAYEKQKSSENA